MNPFLRARWVADTVADSVRIQRRMRIPRTDLVLDVGSGGGPNPRANVLCDKFVSDGAERHGNALVTDRPLIVGDIERLPFADHSFDFVICAHVLEHVRDPAAAIAELQRVGRRGYIETPSAEWEKLAGFTFHRWMVSCVDGKLVFEQKHAPLEDPALHTWFSRFQKEMGIERAVWLNRRRLGVYSWLRWEGEIPFEVHTSPGAEQGFVDAAVDWDASETEAPPLGHAAKLLDSYGRRQRAATTAALGDRLPELLACPACRGQVSRVDRVLRCRSCEAEYPLDSAGRPWLIAGMVASHS